MKISLIKQLIQNKLNMHHYWWILVSIINALFLFIYYQTDYLLKLSASHLSVINLLIATLIRNELILHLLYRLAVWISNVPIGGKYSKYYINTCVHYIGGVHTSCATWGVLWLVIDVVYQFGNLTDPILMVISYTLLTVLFAIIITALPPFRERFHNFFEQAHRYMGWFSLCVLVVYQIRLQFLIAFNETDPLIYFLTEPIILMIVVIIFSIFLPWINVQRFDNYSMYRPSQGVLVLTVPGMGDVGSFVRISTDGVEWHSFSVAGMSLCQETGEPRIRIIIGAVGDWTKNLIRQAEPGSMPKKIWVRRIKPPGFMFSINAYSRVVAIATGAGIAPVLPHVLKNSHKLCIVWVAKDHQQTYGEEIFSMLNAHPRCNIFDTGVHGRPDVGELAIQAAREYGAQAVFCVSNKPLTERVVNTCLKNGIPGYGASWDS